MDHNHMHHNHSMMDMSTTPSTTSMDMSHGGMNHGGDTGHSHGGLGGMDMNDTDRTCQGHMLMFFHSGKCEYILFETLRTSDVGSMVGACIAVFALAVIYEGLKVLREMLLQKSMITANRYAVSNGSSSQDTMVVSNKNVGSLENGNKFSIHMMSCGHFTQTMLHMIQVFISYCLMLVFMTYNAWLCISVVLGAGVGYFMFGWRKAIVVDINEHCH